MNAVMFLLTRFLVPLWRTSGRPAVAYSMFWFVFMNVANLYDYVPIRVAASNGGVWRWIQAEETHMSAWWVYGVVGAFVLWVMIHFYRALTAAVTRRQPDELRHQGRALVLVTATAIMFAYFATPGLVQSDDVSLFIGGTSLLLIPVVILINWRPVVTLGQVHDR